MKKSVFVDSDILRCAYELLGLANDSENFSGCDLIGCCLGCVGSNCELNGPTTLQILVDSKAREMS